MRSKAAELFEITWRLGVIVLASASIVMIIALKLGVYAAIVVVAYRVLVGHY